MDNCFANLENNEKVQRKSELLLYVVLASLMLMVFVTPSLSIVTGPLLTALLTYMFFKGHREFVIAVIVVANDALGTILLGNLSFQYLLLALVGIHMLTKASYSSKRLIFFLVSMAFLIQVNIAGSSSTKMFLMASIYILAIATIRFDGDDDSVKKFFFGVAFTVVVIALHTVITGGVQYYELSKSAIREGEIVRTGILGVGNGNSNFSAFLLIFGFACLWCFTEFKLVFKLIFTYPLLHALVLTRSMSGFLELLLVICVILLLKKKKGRALTIIVAMIVIALVLFELYMSLPAEMHLPELDAYIERIESKLFAFETGDYSSATTNRNDIVTVYMQYIFYDQGNIGMLFGGNPVIVHSISKIGTHNMYLNLLLQFGLLGLIVFVICAVNRIVVNFKSSDDVNAKCYLVLKSLCIFAGFGIGFYSNNLWALWMLSVVFL